MQVVAHQDDDLLFMNPDVQDSIKAGRCIRTVYVTAGDAGEQSGYWGGREQGAKAAYAQMVGVANNWYDEKQDLDGHTVSVAYLNDAPQISLVFLRLPDGNMNGSGFAGHKYQSLTKLLDGSIATIASVDGSASYSPDQLQASIYTIMQTDQTTEIRTQASNNVLDGDHADHHAVGTLTDRATSRYQAGSQQIPNAVHYLGYPDKLLPINLTTDQVGIKQTTFLTYAKFDGAVCQTVFECNQSYTYGNYILRRYQP